MTIIIWVLTVVLIIFTTKVIIEYISYCIFRKNFKNGIQMCINDYYIATLVRENKDKIEKKKKEVKRGLTKKK